MSAQAGGSRGVVCDLRAIQSPDYRGRGVGRWAYELSAALERVRPDLVGCYLLDPTWPPPGSVDELLASDKLHYSGTERAEEAIRSARLFHSFSPFESTVALSRLRPEAVDQLGLAYTATLYDLIPARRPEEYLSDLGTKRDYMARLELLRSADGLLAISGAVAADATGLAGIDPARCHAVGTGVSRHFVAPASRTAARSALAKATGIAGPYLFYPGGSDGRKNVEGLLRAFSELDPELKKSYQLVISGAFPPLTANHYRHLARLGEIEDALVLTGYVPDETLLLLYQGAELLVFPSLEEGYGLPVAEAIACGTPVAVSDRRPLSDLVPEVAARFDPEHTTSIAEVLGRLLRDDGLRQKSLEQAAGQVAGWDEVALRVGEVFESLLPRSRPRRRAHTPRLALVSPLPPMKSGVAHYSSRLAAALARLADETGSFSLDCFADGLDRHPVDREALETSGVRDARTFRAVDAAVGYERVLYVLGNSDCHAAALSSLRVRRGVVMTHDVRLSGLMTLSAEMPGAVPGGLRGALERSYGPLAAEVGRDGSIAPSDVERFGLLFLREVAPHAEKVLVNSASARRLAEIDLGPGLSGRLGVLPFALSQLEEEEEELLAKGRAAREGRPLVASFGILDPSKRPELVVRALALLQQGGRQVDLAFVGQAGTAQRRAVEELAGELGIGPRLEVIDQASRQEYVSWLGRTSVAVQLRQRSYGESSATVSECLSAGLPTIVSDIGWMGELPSSVVSKVSADTAPQELARSIAELLDDSTHAAELGRRGRAYASEHTFEAVATALLAELSL